MGARARYGHNILLITEDTLAAFNLRPLRPDLANELKQLESYYKANQLRYGTLVDIFHDPNSINFRQVSRRFRAALRLARRQIKRDCIEN